MTPREELETKEEIIVEMSSKRPIPLEIQVLNRRAMEFSCHGNYLEALKIFSRVVFIAPGFARAQYELGRCLEYLGRHGEAVERYAKALRLDPLLQP
mgnify:CR=1 FL=1